LPDGWASGVTVFREIVTPIRTPIVGTEKLPGSTPVEVG